MVGGAEFGVGVKPEAVGVEGADSSPGLALAIIDGLDVSHGALKFDASLPFKQALFRAYRRSELWGGCIMRGE